MGQRRWVQIAGAVLVITACASEEDTALGTATTRVDGDTLLVAEDDCLGRDQAPSLSGGACEPAYYVDRVPFVEQCIPPPADVGGPVVLFNGDLYHEVIGASPRTLILTTPLPTFEDGCVPAWVEAGGR